MEFCVHYSARQGPLIIATGIKYAMCIRTRNLVLNLIVI